MQVQTSDLRYLNFVQLSEIDTWSTYALLSQRMVYTKKYSFVRIGDFLTRNKTQIVVQDGTIYKRPTIRMNANGITLRNEVDGKEIGTKNQFRINTGQFLLSKIDARNGAFGVVPEELNDGIITGNFWTFDVNYNKINPHYLTLLTGTKAFQKLSQSASVGTTNRNYLQEESFLNFKIPLPSLPEQEAIVYAYQKKVEKAKLLEEEASSLEQEIEGYLYSELGIKQLQKYVRQKKLQFVDFSEITRWDALSNLSANENLKSKYPIKQFSDVVVSLNKGNDGSSIRVLSSKTPKQEFMFIGMEHIEKESGNLLSNNIVKGKEIKSQTLMVPHGFLIYGKLRPYLNKYWYNTTDIPNIICSSEFLVFDVDENDVNKLYFKYILSCKLIQDQITDKTSGARMPRINESIFKNLLFPLPPLSIQQEIVQTINKLKTQITSNKTHSQALIHQANQEFEKALFT